MQESLPRRKPNNKLLKTVHITNYYHPNSGGISTSYNYLLEYANRNKRHIALIVPGEKEAIEEIGEFARIYYVPAMQSPVFDKRYRMIMPWQFMMHGTLIREILLKENADLIEVCDKYTLSLLAAMIRKNAFKKLGRPMLVHFSCERMDDNVSSFLTKSSIGKWLSRRVMGNYNTPLYDFYVANSVYTAGEYADSVLQKNNPSRSNWFFNACWRFFRAAQVPLNERIFVCSRGGTDPIFSIKNKSEAFREEIKKEVGIPENSKILFYAGRISPEKNIGLLIELMEGLENDKSNDYRLLVAGGGPKADSFKEECEKRLPGKVKMLGHLTDKQKLANLYANCDVFVHPNPREPYGIGPLEAMASGVPVVAPNSGGILSYATQENAWLVNPTGDEFSEAIHKIFAEPERTSQKLANALITVKDSDWEKASAELFEVYDEIYRRFENERQLFAYNEAPKDFDFVKFNG